MKISKARLKQIIKEELEAVVNEEEETGEDQVEEAYAGAKPGPSHRDRPGYQAATVRGRVDARTPTLDAAAEALGMSPSQLMMDLAQEMGVPLADSGDAEPPLEMPEGE
jgi:hypothetical protein